MKMMEIHPLTPELWNDFELLFGPKGAYAGCWCMYWRITRKNFAAGQGEDNRCAMKAIVEEGKTTGLLGYMDGVPVAWCSVAPRDEFASLNRSPVLKKLDDKPVWSIVCLYIHKAHRRKGYAGTMIDAAIDHVRNQGGTIVEAYPSVPASENVAPVSSYMGFPALYEKHGFELCASPSMSKRIMRYKIS